MTPKKLYQQIKSIAEKRYSYTQLPKKLTQLKILESSNNKLSAIRDICLAVGIVINFKGYQNEEKEFILENETEKMKQHISNYVFKQKQTGATTSRKGKRTTVQQQILPDDEIFRYENLPF
jgi:hypothetical protein